MVAAAPEPEPLVRDVLLRDGSTIRLQAPALLDFDDIKAFYDGLSPESRYLRVHGFGRTDTVARADAEASGVDGLALISRHEDRVVAAATYDGLREPGAAEVAFAVADDDQRRGDPPLLEVQRDACVQKRQRPHEVSQGQPLVILEGLVGRARISHC